MGTVYKTTQNVYWPFWLLLAFRDFSRLRVVLLSKNDKIDDHFTPIRCLKQFSYEIGDFGSLCSDTVVQSNDRKKADVLGLTCRSRLERSRGERGLFFSTSYHQL